MIASVYYNSSSWHQLITNVIVPFIKQEQSSMIWHILLGTGQGDHITFAVKPSDDKGLQERFCDKVERFLAEYPSETEPVEYPLNSFFMNYPNNSVFFARSKQLSDSLTENRSGQMRQQISKALIQALAEDEIETESIYTFLVYMQLGIIKAAYPVLKQACVKTRGLANHSSKPEGDAATIKSSREEDSNDFTQLFEQNRDILTEIIKDVWSERVDPELQWLEEWMENCRNYLQSQAFEQAFFTLSKLICEHTGLKDEKLPYLSSGLLLNTFNQLPGSFLNNDRIIRIA